MHLDKESGHAGFRQIPGGEQSALGADASVILNRNLHADIAAGLVRRLAGPGLPDVGGRKGHVLVTGEKNIEVQLLTHPPGLILRCIGEGASGGNVVFKAAVIDTDRELGPGGPELFERFAGGIHGIGDLDPREMFRLFPYRDERSRDAGEADTQTVFQCDDGGALDLRQSVNIGTEAAGVETVEVALQNFTTVVEIVVSQGDKLITGEVHEFCGNKGSVFRSALLQPVGEGAALKDVAAVDDEAVPVPDEVGRAVGEACGGQGRGGVIDRGKISVGIAGKINVQCSFHS